MLPCHPSRARRSRALVVPTLLAAAAIVGAGAPSTQAAARPSVPAPITLQRAIAEPVTASSPCTVEPRAELYGNTTFDPAVPTEWFGGINYPAAQDVVPDLRAGANSDFCIGFSLPPDVASTNVDLFRDIPADMPANPNTIAATGDDQRDITIDLPRGFAANLTNIATCSDADFGVDGTDTTASTAARGPAQCADASVVGDAVVRISTSLLNVHTLLGGAYTPGGDYPGGAIYRLTAGPNELGRLGVQVYPTGLGGVKPSKFTVRLILAPDGSGRVRAVVRDAPRTHFGSGVKDLYIESVWFRMWGAKADHPASTVMGSQGTALSNPALNGDFLETPTDCSAAVSAHMKVTTYGGARAADPATYAPVTSELDSPAIAPTGCGALPFDPTVSVTTTEHTPATPTGVAVRLHLGQARAGGRLPALLQDAAVTLPAGLELGAQVASDADGLQLCTAAQFAEHTPLTANACPAATVAGDLLIHSPLIDQPLVGKVYLGTPGGGRTLPDLYLEAALAGATAADAPRIKLVGATTVDDTGRITATFADAPPLRFDDLQLTFPGGAHALFSTPQRCGTTSGRSLITPNSGAAPTPVDARLTIDQGCGSAFTPTARVESLDAQSGKKAPARITITRPAGSAWIKRIGVHLPSGFLADLNAASECAAAQAQTGACPDSSRIGTLNVLAGAGDQPLPLSGAMYLTERQPGDVAGAVLVTRAKLGDLDLGDVVVPGRIALRPADAGLDFTADVPLRFKGLALQLQKIEVTLDRDGFALNPSACGPLGYSADVTGDTDETVGTTGSITYTGCDKLPFHPTLKATLTGDNTPGGHPGMYVRLDSPAGDASLRSAAVTLPAGVATDRANLQTPCSAADFDAVRCPAASRVGTAVAHVSITAEAVTGDVYLIKVPGKILPGLGLSFTGRYAQRVTSTVEVNKDGRIVTNFGAIPDLPLRALEINVDSGPHSPLQLPQGACANGSNWDGVFVGQGGQTASAKTGLQCAAPANARLSDKRGLTVRLFDFGGRKLQSLKATLPKGWRFDTKAAKKKDAFWVRMTNAKPKVKLTSTSLTAVANAKTATDVRVKITGKVVRPISAAAKRAKRVDIALRLAFIDGTVQTQTLSVATR